MRLKGRRAIVTGGGSGLGAAAARRFASEGARVVVADIDLQAAEAVARDIDPEGRNARACACDVTQSAQTDALVATAVDFFGDEIDVFLSNAGVGFRGDYLAVEDDYVAGTVGVNLTGAIFASRSALRSMARNGSGSLLFTASLQSVMGRAQRSVYTATKHAVTGLVKSLALEFGPRGIRVNAIAPGSIDTPLLRKQLSAYTDDVGAQVARLAQKLPLQKMPTVDDFAACALFLASDEAGCITGQTLVLDSGTSAGDADFARK